ncbi:anti-sigma regulatory factor [Clostridia bacterium]|nr:anti-sigma regulatory factor [Clostridia bacterium]
MDDKLHLTYDVSGGDFTSCGKASESVKYKLKQLGVSSDAIRRAAIAMYEGEVNMVIHAGGGAAAVDIFEDHVEITLTDCGPGIADVEAAMREGYSTAGEAIRELGFGAGMGLPNMKRYSDEMKINTKVGEGTAVFLRINF